MAAKLAIVFFALCLAGAASGTTYTYAGKTYSIAGSPYTTAMSITGTFDTAAPLPANTNFLDIGPRGSGLVTGWSFSDGVNTYTQGNSDGVFSVTTDAKGNFSFYVISLTSPRPPIALNDLVNVMDINSCCGPIYDLAVNQAVCNMVNQANQCVGTASANSGIANSPGAFNPAFAAIAPTIAKAFAATSVLPNGTTSLTFTLTNPDGAASLTGVAFTDGFPAGMVVATPNGLSNTCGGVATAVQGTGSVSLAGATIAPSSNCTLAVNVTATAASGQLVNTSGAVTSTNSLPGNTASATLGVVLPPQQIPALEQWTLRLLELLLAVSGAMAIACRRRKAR